MDESPKLTLSNKEDLFRDTPIRLLGKTKWHDGIKTFFFKLFFF